MIFALVVLLIVGQWLRDYRAGRELYAIGSNPEGARLAGVRSERRVLTAFVLSGMLAGLGGVLFTARFGTVDATAGTGYELTVIAAAVVGGVAIFGGDRERLRRGARRAAARHDHVVADRPARRGVLAAGGDRRPAADRDRVRPARRACASTPPCGGGARAVPPETATRPPRPPRRPPTSRAARLARSLLGRWETLLVGLLVVMAIAGQAISPEFLTADSFTTGSLDLSEVALMALPLDADDHRRGDRPLGRLACSPSRAR